MLYTTFYLHKTRRGSNAIEFWNALAIFTVAFLNNCIDRVTGVKKGWNTFTFDTTCQSNILENIWRVGQFYIVQVGYEVVTIGEVMSRKQFCDLCAEHLTFSDTHHIISLLNFLIQWRVVKIFSYPIWSCNSPAGKNQAIWNI